MIVYLVKELMNAASDSVTPTNGIVL